jgi:hypothetical protein
MEVNNFAAELLHALADTKLFERVDINTEGPIVNGHIYVQDKIFVRFYFNQDTQTIAFALIKEKQRIWGIDRDNRRGWHVHPDHDPTSHFEIEPLSVSEIVAQLRDVLIRKVEDVTP